MNEKKQQIKSYTLTPKTGAMVEAYQRLLDLPKDDFRTRSAVYVDLILRLLSKGDRTIWDLMGETGELHKPALFEIMCEMERRQLIFAGYKKYHYSIRPGF